MRCFSRATLTTFSVFLTTILTVFTPLHPSSFHHINKTYFNARSHGANQALICAAGTDSIIHRKDSEKFGGFLQAIVWYARGEMDDQYWSPVDKKYGFTFGTAGADVTVGDKKFVDVESADLDARLFVLKTRTAVETAESEIGKIDFEPKQNAYGITLFYDHRLDQLLRGLYFNVTLPIAYVENSLNPQFLGEQRELLESYFFGKKIAPTAASPDDKDHQDPLTYALMSDQPTQAGIADIDVNLGYTFYEKEKRHARAYVGITIPTSSNSNGKYLFNSIVGNGDHFGLGGGFEADQRIWGDLKHNIILHAKVDFRYLIENSQHRVLGLKDISYGHYHLLAQIANPTATLPMHDPNKNALPAANVLAQDVFVTPGGRFDGIMYFAYNNDNFAANLGYNVFVREAETVSLCDRNPLADKKYGLIKPHFLTNVCDATAGTGCYRLTQLDADDLDIDAAQTPAQTTHKIFGSLAYTFKEWDAQYHFALGGHYEFCDGGRGLDTWGINVRFGIGM